MQLDPSITLHPESNSRYVNMSNPISYSFLFQSYDDNPFNEILETTDKLTYDNTKYAMSQEEIKEVVIKNKWLNKAKFKNAVFAHCLLHETDFTESDFTGTVFNDCDFSLAVFNHANLEKTDFRTSYNYSINPENNRIKKAKFSLPAVTGLLDTYDIEIEDI